GPRQARPSSLPGVPALPRCQPARRIGDRGSHVAQTNGQPRNQGFACYPYDSWVTSAMVVAEMPTPVVELLNKALVGELTVIDRDGRFRTDPLIPLWDGHYILMTSSILFSRKLEDIKRNPKVSLSLSDPIGVPAQPFSRATIQGDARVIDDDRH